MHATNYNDNLDYNNLNIIIVTAKISNYLVSSRAHARYEHSSNIIPTKNQIMYFSNFYYLKETYLPL